MTNPGNTPLLIFAPAVPSPVFFRGRTRLSDPRVHRGSDNQYDAAVYLAAERCSRAAPAGGLLRGRPGGFVICRRHRIQRDLHGSAVHSWTSNADHPSATKIDQSTVATVRIFSEDVAGNQIAFDPAFVTVYGSSGPAATPLADIPSSEYVLTVTNGSPGLERLVILPLTGGETRTLNLRA